MAIGQKRVLQMRKNILQIAIHYVKTAKNILQTKN